MHRDETGHSPRLTANSQQPQPPLQPGTGAAASAGRAAGVMGSVPGTTQTAAGPTHSRDLLSG